VTEKIRVAIVVSHPIQHFIHLYRALAKQPFLDLLVIYCSDIGVRKYFDKGMGVEITWHSDLLSGYKHVFLPEASRINGTGFQSVNNPSISRVLKEFSPHIVKLHGYAQITLLRALFWCRLHGVPVLIWSDSELLRMRKPLKRFLKQLVLRPFFSLFSGFLTVGENNEAYFRNYGVSARRMFRTPFTFDEDAIQKSRENRDSIRKEMRTKLGIPASAFVVLVVGKLVEYKRPGDVIEALRLLKGTRNNGKAVYAVFVGDGVIRDLLEKQCEGARENCRFAGFVNIDELPDYYVMADVLAHVSDVDAHPLCNSEAILSGLPLILSDKVGTIGATDVARPGKNAIVCSCGDTRAVAYAIERLASDKELYDRMKDESLKIAKELNISASVRGFMNAVYSVMR